MKANPVAISQLLFAAGAPLPPWVQTLISEENVFTKDVRMRGQRFFSLQLNDHTEANLIPGETAFTVRRPGEKVIRHSFDNGKVIALVKDGRKTAQLFTCFICWKKTGHFVRIIDSNDREELRLFRCSECGREWKLTLPPSVGRVPNARKKKKSHRSDRYFSKRSIRSHRQ